MSEGRQNENHNHIKLIRLIVWTTALSNSEFFESFGKYFRIAHQKEIGISSKIKKKSLLCRDNT